MTVYSKETALYNTNAIQSGLEGAADAYKVVITEMSSTGLILHPNGQGGSTGVQLADYLLLDDDGMEVFDGGSSVCEFGQDGARMGLANAEHVVTDATGTSIMDGASTLARFSGDGMELFDGGVSTALYGEKTRIGKVAELHIESRPDRLSFMAPGTQLPNPTYTNGVLNSLPAGTVQTGEVAYLATETVNGVEESVFYIVHSVVVKDIKFGDNKWKWWKRDNDNMTLKWMG